MQRSELPFGDINIEIHLPEEAEIFSMGTPDSLADPAMAIQEALDAPIGSESFNALVARKLKEHADPQTVIVISDNTRPVPYSGKKGILWPLVERLTASGLDPRSITVLVATGMHRGLSNEELGRMIDPRVRRLGVNFVNHNGKDAESLTSLGTTARGSQVYINKLYIDSDIKILTGLVESHFMAGASGGRKSICPGLVGERSTRIFHGAEMMGDPDSTDLFIKGNPCHEESFEVASMAGADFILNVTLDHAFNLTGVFAGELKAAHEAAVGHLRSYTAFPYTQEYDLVVTHAGFVGINHYQAAKVGTVAARILKPGGHLIVVANNCDTDPVGSLEYRTVLQLLTINGPAAIDRLLRSPDWSFIPEQWQVQMWCRLFKKIPLDHFHYYSPQFGAKEYALVPGSRLAELAGLDDEGDPVRTVPKLITAALERLIERFDGTPRIAYLKDGPYGIPIKNG
jgi:nickel-dependent lactate racemase